VASINNIEAFREILKSGRVAIGQGITFSDSAVSELIAEAGYDFSWIDTEHAALSLESALHHVVAHRGTAAAPFVRVQQNDVNVIKRVLDLAPAGIIIPQVNSATEATAAVRACRYPPQGVRGFGPRRGARFGAISQPDYLAEFADNPLIVIQIEHAKAVANIDEMLEVPGIDVYCLGPNDLSGSYGKLGQIQDAQVQEAINLVASRVVAANKVLGVSTFYSPETYSRWMQLGVKWINLNVDFANLFRASRQVIEAARST
jgi:2-keto-3-deoxy-L-rhamnonate aldolase RhmA